MTTQYKIRKMKNNPHSGFTLFHSGDEGDATDMCLVFLLDPGQAEGLLCALDYPSTFFLFHKYLGLWSF